MADYEIRIEDPQEAWDALYAKISALAEREAGSEPEDSTAQVRAAPDEVFLALWGFL